MPEWGKIFSGIKDESLLFMAGIVVLVIWLCFRLLRDGLKIVADQFVAKDAQKAAALQAVADEMKKQNEVNIRQAVLMEQIRQHQELCISNRQSRKRGGSPE